MIILLTYAIAGIITSRFFLKKNMMVAYIAHTVFFIIFGAFLFFLPVGSIQFISRYLVTKDFYILIKEIVTEPYEISIISLSVFSSIIMVLVSLMIIAIGIVVLDLDIKIKICIVCLILKYNKYIKERIINFKICNYRIYIKNCSLRY